jgi:hypothetical protein
VGDPHEHRAGTSQVQRNIVAERVLGRVTLTSGLRAHQDAEASLQEGSAPSRRALSPDVVRNIEHAGAGRP